MKFSSITSAIRRLQEQHRAISRILKLLPQSPPAVSGAQGRNGPFFLPAVAEAFKRDMPTADVRFFDTGHFALETHCDEIAAAIRVFGLRMGG